MNGQMAAGRRGGSVGPFETFGWSLGHELKLLQIKTKAAVSSFSHLSAQLKGHKTKTLVLPSALCLGGLLMIDKRAYMYDRKWHQPPGREEPPTV